MSSLRPTQSGTFSIVRRSLSFNARKLVGYQQQVASGKRIPKDNGVQRYKGLGEMNHQELWDTTMNPVSRTLLQVTLDDAAMADAVFSTLMGEDVESRRTFIQQNAKDVRFLDI